MHWRLLSLILLAAASARGAELNFDFTTLREGEVPAGFRSTVTGRGEPGTWRIVMGEVPVLIAPLSDKAPESSRRAVLAQLSSQPEETRAPLFLYTNLSFHDFTFSTRLKVVNGDLEQMAGVAFRIQDERNYYYVRVNAKNRNVAFFRYVDGELIGPISAAADVKRGEWNQLAVECRGSRLRVLLNEREVIPWMEPNLVPFPDGTSTGVFPSGQVAFWTKADTVAHFADARIDYIPREPFAQTLVREVMKANPRLVALRVFGLSTNGSGTQIIASTDEKEIGQPGEALERECIEKGEEVALVTMPLHDRNGDIVGAVRVSMTTFLGQTERNALARATPIVKAMEGRIVSAKELVQ
jgi:hypothetical protein